MCYNKWRYIRGRFETQEEASKARHDAEQLLKADPNAFVEHYEECPKHAI